MIAMALYLVLANVIPKLVTKPTDIKVIDDLVMYIIAQKGSLTSGVIFIGLIMYSANYINTSVLDY